MTRTPVPHVILLLLVAMAGSTPVRAQQREEKELRTLLTGIEQAWNNADLDGHVAVYADSAAMMGRNGPFYGRDRIKDLLARNFWRDGRPLQQLRFEQVTVRLFAGKRAAIVTGRFILTGGDRPEQSGWFTTVWEKQGKTWVTLHDSSG